MKDDDELYARYQTLAALMGVLLHDLRNPLHSATLLLEAMGSKTADVTALRGKLRGQFAKLEGLMSEAGDSIKALRLEPRMADVDLDGLLHSVATLGPALSGHGGDISVPSSTGLRVSTDPTLLLHAVAEIVGHVLERAAAGGETAARIALRVDEPDPTSVRLNVGDFKMPIEDPVTKAPSIGGGGARLALARGLSQMAGAALRVESNDGRTYFALHLRRAT
jgi:signal transduction histidine kinase